MQGNMKGRKEESEVGGNEYTRIRPTEDVKIYKQKVEDVFLDDMQGLKRI